MADRVESAKGRARGERHGWRSYQESVAQLFRELGCIVETDARIQGARAQHDIDVWVRFARFGVQQAWVIDTKLWTRRVPKKEVLALKGVVDDVGADRGILVAESGHQRGAQKAALNVNVTLTTLGSLRESAKADLLTRALTAIMERAVALRRQAHAMFEHTNWREGEFSGGTSSPWPGVDGEAVFRVIGDAGILQIGTEQAQLGHFPAVVRFRSGDQLVRADNLAAFVEAASDLLEQLEGVVAAQNPRRS